MRRAVIRLPVIAPNAGLWVFILALPKCVWLNVLNVFQRNCVFTLSPNRTL